MKRQRYLPLLALGLLALAACTRLNSAQEKAGYAVGMSIGQNLERIKEKVDVGKLSAGFREELAGKASMDDAAMAEQLQQLRPDQVNVDKAKIGYAVGVSIAKNLARVKDQLETARVLSGIKDQLAGKPKLTQDQMREALQSLTQAESSKNRAAGQAFLDANKKRPGVKVTASGLQYEVLTAGAGRKPGAKNTVRVHYRGTLTDGTEFDSSYARKTPAEFPLDGVIPGWTEGLQLMGVGAKFRFVIPSELAYGSHGQGPSIPPDAVLVFEVELLAIVK